MSKEFDDNWDSGDWDSGYEDWGKIRITKYNNLKIASGIYLSVFVIVLIILGGWGWNSVQTSIDRKFKNEAIATSVGTPLATPTNTPGPSPTPTSTLDNQSPAWAGDKNSLEAAATQHYFGLVVVGGILVLFPALLLTAYAFQQVPRLTKDLEDDLIKLGIFPPEPNPYEQQMKLENKIRELAPELDPRTVTGMARALREINPEVEEITIPQTKGFPSEKITELQSYIQTTYYEESRVSGKRDANRKFEDLINNRFGWFEYLLPLIVLSLFLLACFVWLFWPTGLPDFINFTNSPEANFNVYFAGKLASMLPVLASVLAAYVFLIMHLVRRNKASDLTPGAFWEALRRLAAVFILGLLLSVFGNPNEELQQGMLIIIAIFVGLFPTGFLNILARGGQALLNAWLEKQLKLLSPDSKLEPGKDMAERLYSRHELYLLDDLDEWDTIRLEEANIYGLQGMATADLANLIAWTPFTTSQIVDWVDQSLLYMTSGAEPDSSFAKTFRAIGLRQASALVELAKDALGKNTIVLAARAIQASGVSDPLPVAQLAAVRAQLQIKDMQDKVAKVKGKTTTDNLDATLKSDIESAISLIAAAKNLVDQAYEQVKAGGELLKDALANQADPLKSVLHAADDEAIKAQSELKNITGNDPKVSQNLSASLKTIGDKLAGDPDANKRAKDLVDELDRIANPMKEAEKKSGEFSDKAEEIQKTAQTTTTDVPAQVQEASGLLEELTTMGKDAQKRIKADKSLEKILSTVDDLVKELESEEENKAKKLLGDDKLKKKESWTTAGNDKKAQCAPDADKLVEVAKGIASKAKSASTEITSLRAEKAAGGVSLPLTHEVLSTILAGLKGNANLKRVQRYIKQEGRSVPEG